MHELPGCFTRAPHALQEQFSKAFLTWDETMKALPTPKAQLSENRKASRCALCGAFLDIGQGRAILLERGRRKTWPLWLIDGWYCLCLELPACHARAEQRREMASHAWLSLFLHLGGLSADAPMLPSLPDFLVCQLLSRLGCLYVYGENRESTCFAQETAAADERERTGGCTPI